MSFWNELLIAVPITTIIYVLWYWWVARHYVQSCDALITVYINMIVLEKVKYMKLVNGNTPIIIGKDDEELIFPEFLKKSIIIYVVNFFERKKIEECKDEFWPPKDNFNCLLNTCSNEMLEAWFDMLERRYETVPFFTKIWIKESNNLITKIKEYFNNYR